MPVFKLKMKQLATVIGFGGEIQVQLTASKIKNWLTPAGLVGIIVGGIQEQVE